MSTSDDKSADTQRSESMLSYYTLILCLVAMSFSSLLILFWCEDPSWSVKVTSLSVSNFSVSESSDLNPSVTGNWLLKLVIDNNDKNPFSFTDLESHLYYRNNELATARVTPFSMGKLGFTEISIAFLALDYYIKPLVAGQMNSDWMLLGEMNFDFIVGDNISITCEDTPVKFNKNSTGNGGWGSTGKLMVIPWNCEASR